MLCLSLSLCRTDKWWGGREGWTDCPQDGLRDMCPVPSQRKQAMGSITPELLLCCWVWLETWQWAQPAKNDPLSNHELQSQLQDGDLIVVFE